MSPTHVDLFTAESPARMSDAVKHINSDRVYHGLYLPRAIEERMLRLIRQGKISKWFSGYGQEAISVGCTLALDNNDCILPLHRNLGVWTTRGVELKPLLCQLIGRDGGFTRGRDRTFHFGLPEKRIVGMISHLGAMLPVATGIALAQQMKEARSVTCVFIGEGATREGDFHEALNLAAVWKLPLIIIVENNQYGLSTPVAEVMAAQDITLFAPAYGMHGRVVDGNNVSEVMDAVKDAADRARNGMGPTLLEMKTFRIRGHEEASGVAYVPPELISTWTERDPLQRFREKITADELLSDERLREIEQEVEKEVQIAADYALAQPEVTSTADAERAAVFAPAPFIPRIPTGGLRNLRFVDALAEGLRQTMDQDESVILLGQDIAEYGGVFKLTQGFVDRFGSHRVRNTPIIESGAIGAAMGLALEGFKPVVEIQYADFIACGFNQIVNNLATTHYRWGAALNVTIRAPFGGGIGAGPFHSQSPEAWFCHAPGLKVVIPSNPQNAKGLLAASISDPNPVLFFEHKFLYRNLRGEVPDSLYHTPIGKAEIVRRGDAATIVTYGIGVRWALEEASILAKKGIEIEIVDLRTLTPWDRETVTDSLRRTNRLLVLHEAWRTGGFGAEICAQVIEESFAHLDAPPMRVASEDTPVPFAAHIETSVFSANSRLESALRRLLAY